VNTVRVRSSKIDCTECRDALLADCHRLGLPVATEESFLIPERWRFHKCSHRKDGFLLHFDPETLATEKVIEDEISLRSKGAEEFEAPEDNLDATKGIGYPARERSKYGSHPVHDGFDDESEP
jgi:hypothetical protein